MSELVDIVCQLLHRHRNLSKSCRTSIYLRHISMSPHLTVFFTESVFPAITEVSNFAEFSILTPSTSLRWRQVKFSLGLMPNNNFISTSTLVICLWAIKTSSLNLAIFYRCLFFLRNYFVASQAPATQFSLYK